MFPVQVKARSGPGEIVKPHPIAGFNLNQAGVGRANLLYSSYYLSHQKTIKW